MSDKNAMNAGKMTRFKTETEWREFCDTSMNCLCGKLMTGFHMRTCSRVRKQDERWKTINGAMRETESGNFT